MFEPIISYTDKVNPCGCCGPPKDMLIMKRHLGLLLPDVTIFIRMKKAINKKRNGFIYQLQQSCNIPLHEMEIDVARCSVFYRAYMEVVMAHV